MPSSDFFETDDTISELFGRTQESLEEDVAAVKKWIKSQPHLPETLGDEAIQNFLMLNKCSIEKTKRGIDMYYSLRSQIPDFYDKINPKCANIERMMQMAAWVPLPKLTKERYRVLFFKMLKKDLIDEMQPENVVALFHNFQEVRLKEDVMFGDIFVYDMDGINFSYLAKLTPSFIAKAASVYEKVFSLRMKGIYVLNSPPFIGTVLTILRNVLNPKLFQRIHVCQDTSILTKTFPKEILPRDYGGEEKSIEELNDLFKLKLNQYQDRFDKLDRMRVKEDLRPQKLKNDDILGFHGNFKKLSVD